MVCFEISEGFGRRKSTAPKRSVGRPRKSSVRKTSAPKRRVGRPRKSSVRKTSTHKRRVGRPRSTHGKGVVRNITGSAVKHIGHMIVDKLASLISGGKFVGAQVLHDHDFGGVKHHTLFAKYYDKIPRSAQTGKPKRKASELQLLNLAKGRAKREGNMALYHEIEHKIAQYKAGYKVSVPTSTPSHKRRRGAGYKLTGSGMSHMRHVLF
jgi:hypothetical protein